MKNRMIKAKGKRVVMATVCVLLAVSCAMLVHYKRANADPFQAALREASNHFGIDDLRYSEVMFFAPLAADKNGNGEQLLEVRLTKSSAKKFLQQAKGRLIQLPMPKKIEHFDWSCDDRIIGKLKQPAHGYYGYYNLDTREVMDLDEMMVRTEGNFNPDEYLVDHEFPMEFIYLQYDSDENLLTLWRFKI